MCLRTTVLRHGVNHKEYDASKDHLVTAASCTTNCLAPVVSVVLKNLGIVRGSITTIHNVTNTQTIVDAPNQKKSDLRRARSGLTNLAPTSTGYGVRVPRPCSPHKLLAAPLHSTLSRASHHQCLTVYEPLTRST